MTHPKRHIHDWQWSEEYGCYLCACGQSMQPEESHRVEPVEQPHAKPIERPRIVPDPPISSALEIFPCWSCYGSGYSDYSPGKPCEVCGGWGHWEDVKASQNPPYRK